MMATIAYGQQELSHLRPLELELPADFSKPVDLEKAPKVAKTFLTSLALDMLPNEYEDNRKWGGQKKRWDGLKVRVDGLQVRTKRRWKSVNHGTWKKYRLQLVDPDKYLSIKITDLESSGSGKFSFDLALQARLDVHGRLQEWNNGVRLLSVSTDAVADVDLIIRFDVTTSLDVSQFPPGVRIDPVADQAELRLSRLRVKRIGKADGPVVDELGDALKKFVRRKLEKDNAKLVAKINKQIAKNEDKLHLSIRFPLFK